MNPYEIIARVLLLPPGCIDVVSPKEVRDYTQSFRHMYRQQRRILKSHNQALLRAGELVAKEIIEDGHKRRLEETGKKELFDQIELMINQMLSKARDGQTTEQSMPAYGKLKRALLKYGGD